MPKLSLIVALTLIVSAQSFAQAQFAAPRPRTPQARLFTETNIEKAWQVAAKQQKPMLVMFTSDNCRFCKKMLAETYGHPGIQQMLAGRTQTVLAHSDDYGPLIKKLGIRGFPSSVLISPKGDVLDFMEGYVAPKDFAQRVSPLLRSQVARKPVAQPIQQTSGR